VEGPAQRAVLACDGNLAFLHGLQQGRLGAGAGAVDLVGHQELGKDRALEEAEAALAGGALVQHLGAENVGRHQVGRELDALVGKTEGSTHRFDEAGLGKTRRADQQGVAAGQHCRERQLDHLLLSEDRPADFGLHLGEGLGGRVGFRNDDFGS